MLLLAILTGFPRLSPALFGAITQQEPMTFSPRAFFADVAGHSVAGPDADMLQSCLGPLLKTEFPDSGEPIVRGAPGVARFSFYTAKVAELKAWRSHLKPSRSSLNCSVLDDAQLLHNQAPVCAIRIWANFGIRMGLIVGSVMGPIPQA